MDYDKFFRIEKISASTTRIYGFTGEIMYLVEGTKKAVLIDTGAGVGNLKSLIDSLTKKPYFVLLTHGHTDHAMGAAQFTDVYMNFADKFVFKIHSNMDLRKDYIKTTLGFINGDLSLIQEDDYILTNSCDDFKNLLPGDKFDLGNINIEILGGAGHTPGMVTILIVEERALILGDACNEFTFLFDEEALGLTTYEKNLAELNECTKGRYDKVYMSHGPGIGHVKIIESVLKICQDIKLGNTDDIPFNFMGKNAFIAKAGNPMTGREDGGIGNIIYNKDKINL